MKTDIDGGRWNFFYSETCNVTKVVVRWVETAPSCRTAPSRVDYAPRDRLRVHDHGDGQRTDYELDDQGNVAAREHLRANLTERVAYTYVGDQLRTAQVVAPDVGEVQRLFHDDRGRQYCATRDAPETVCARATGAQPQPGLAETWGYDYLDRSQQYDAWAADGTPQQHADYLHDALGRLEQQSERHHNSGDVEGLGEADQRVGGWGDACPQPPRGAGGHHLLPGRLPRPGHEQHRETGIAPSRRSRGGWRSTQCGWCALPEPAARRQQARDRGEGRGVSRQAARQRFADTARSLRRLWLTRARRGPLRCRRPYNRGMTPRTRGTRGMTPRTRGMTPRTRSIEVVSADDLLAAIGDRLAGLRASARVDRDEDLLTLADPDVRRVALELTEEAKALREALGR